MRANPFSVSRRFHVQQPTTVINAQFSYAHSFAMLALNIPVGPAWYWEENMASNRVRAFRERVEVIPEPLAADLARWVERGQFRRLPGGVDVHARGRVFSETIDNARGDPWRTETLLTDRQLTEKFFGMVAPAGSKNEAHRRQLGERILDTVERLEEVTDLGEFLELLDLNSI